MVQVAVVVLVVRVLMEQMMLVVMVAQVYLHHYLAHQHSMLAVVVDQVMGAPEVQVVPVLVVEVEIQVDQHQQIIIQVLEVVVPLRHLLHQVVQESSY
jgi:hypothetical protein